MAKRTQEEGRVSDYKKQKNDVTILAFYTQKGGVCKTTNAIAIARAMVKHGKRVLLYDCDPQRSATAYLFKDKLHDCAKNVDYSDPLAHVIESTRGKNVQLLSSLYMQIIDQNIIVRSAHAIEIEENMWLVPGDTNISGLDCSIHNEELLTSEKFCLLRQSTNNLTGKPYVAILATAKNYNIDIVILDLSPNNGKLNRTLVTCSDYLITPTTPDFFCAQTIDSMYLLLNDWVKEMSDLKLWVSKFPDSTHYPIRSPIVTFLGYILNRVNNSSEDNKCKCWIERIDRGSQKLGGVKLGQLKDWSQAVPVEDDYFEICNIILNKINR